MARRGESVPIDKATLVQPYVERGLSLDGVAAELGVGVNTVRRRLLEYAIPTRSRGARPGHTDRYRRPADVLTRSFLVEAYQRKGMTIAQLVVQTGFSKKAVMGFLRLHGIRTRPSGFTVQHHIDRKDVANLRREGLTVAEIADRLGCSERTIERALRRYGIGR